MPLPGMGQVGKDLQNSWGIEEYYQDEEEAFNSDEDEQTTMEVEEKQEAQGRERVYLQCNCVQLKVISHNFREAIN